MSRPNDDIRLVMLGHWGVGKSSIVRRLCGQPIEHTHASTIGAAYSSLRVGDDGSGALKMLGRYEQFDGDTYKVGVWDTAGQERFKALLPFYTRNSDGAFVVFDHDPETASAAEEAAMDFRHRYAAERPNATDPPPICLLQNKCDLPQFEFNTEVVDRIQPDCGGSTSALLNDNVERYFLRMVELCIERKTKLKAAREAERTAGSEPTVAVDAATLRQRVRGWCSYL